MKKLKILSISNNNFSNTAVKKIHLDYVDNLLSEEHYGKYIIIANNKVSTSRLYFSFNHYLEYYMAKKSCSNEIIFFPPKKSNFLILDNHKKYKILIESIIKNVFLVEEAKKTIKKEIYGLDIFLKMLNYFNIMLEKETSITIEHQESAYNYCYDNKLTKSAHSNLRQFFGLIERIYPYLPAIDSYEGSRKESREALSSTVVFKLDYYARENLNTIIYRVEEYKKWLKEFDSDKLFSIGNLASTYYSRIDLYGSKASGFNRTINEISIKLYSIDLHCWKYIKKKEYYYNNEKEKKDHNHLLTIAKKGINIDIVNEKMFAVWHKAIFPNFPFENNAKNELKDIFTDRSRFIEKIIKRLKSQENITIEIIDIYSRIFPTIHEVYPLILLLLAREGINTDTLFHWNIEKNFNTKSISLGNTSSIALVIEALKSKINTNQSTVIGNDSKQKKYIDFYLTWMKEYYFLSKSNQFLQYISESDYKIKEMKISNFISIFNQSRYFLKKYNISDMNGKRINTIKHSRLRVYGNYATYLKGLNNFERQFVNGHVNIDTQSYYENNVEWKEQQKYKISKIQNNIINIIRGKEVNSKLSKLFEGPIADCSDPKNPTFIGYSKSKKNDICSSWTKCLTQCNKSFVIPNIHGPVIYAWISFMTKEKEEYIRESDWEKEYLIDYESAINVFSDFTSVESEFSKNNAYKYESFVQRRFYKNFKLKNEWGNNAG